MNLRFISNSSTIDIESWFIPFNILTIVLTILTVGLAGLFLFLILVDKQCHTIPMMLIANSCLTAFVFGCTMLACFIFILENDLKQIQYQDSFCIFRAYIAYATCGVFDYSFLLQALYRYVIVVYPSCLLWQLPRNQMLLIVLTWILGFLFPVVFLFTDEIIYNADNQVCQLPLRFSFSVNYIAFSVYTLPVLLILCIYMKLIRYVKQMSDRVTPVRILFRAERELKMVRRILILVIILIGVGFVYAIFILISFFTDPPKHHFRIAYVFGSVSFLLVIITLFLFTKPLKISIENKLNRLFQ
jgi:hypothetical protein